MRNKWDTLIYYNTLYSTLTESPGAAITVILYFIII